MNRYARAHLTDPSLLCQAEQHLAQDRGATAELLADLAEIDHRKLYLQAAQPSMHAFCVQVWRLSEDAASKRIHAARAARRFPAIFAALAEGRLHLSAVVLLAPHLTEATVDELRAAATHQTKGEIERLLAERLPRSEMLAWVETLPGSSGARSSGEHAPGHVIGTGGAEALPAPPPAVTQQAPGHVGDRCRLTPLAGQRVGVQFSLSQGEYEELCYVQALLGHQVPSGDFGKLVVRMAKVCIPQLERRKFAATARPRRSQKRSTSGSRHIPAAVRRAVWERDGGQCTFVSEAGHRCEARRRLEYDHIEPFARGGEATEAGIRLRCRAHNMRPTASSAPSSCGTSGSRPPRRGPRQSRARRPRRASGRPPMRTRRPRRSAPRNRTSSPGSGRSGSVSRRPAGRRSCARTSRTPRSRRG